MFSYYIGIEDSFIVSNWEVTGGTASREEIHEGCWLEAAEFSDFQVDPLTGDIFGEIRLAYWHDGDKTIPVSGGSVSGNMNELVKQMRMSRETRQCASARIPTYIRLEGVTVTGSED
jgi:PmbA protein